MTMRRAAATATVALLALLVCPPPAAPQTAVREITQIAGPVYRFRNNNHYSIFAVTPAGIVVTDPINADAAQWLEAELAQRFNMPVRLPVPASTARRSRWSATATDQALDAAFRDFAWVVSGEVTNAW
jgi:hypothetical protein